jgi:hypothetical protein
VTIDASVAGIAASECHQMNCKPATGRSVFSKNCADSGEIVIIPEALRAGEAAIIAQRLRQALERKAREFASGKMPR